MKLREIYDRIDARYPKRLSDAYIARFGGHDNSGILLMDAEREITGAVFSLDFSQGAIAAADKAGKNLIVTHHPAIFFPVSSLCSDDPLGARLMVCMQKGIGVVSMHLNCDCAANGIDQRLAEAAGAWDRPYICEPVEDGGYGRIYAVRERSLEVFVEDLMKNLGANRRFVYGPLDAKVMRVASFCGAGVDSNAIAAAKQGGAQVIVSADIKHNFICDALEAGLCVVQLTHYASENFGFKKIYQSLKDELGVPCEYFEDPFML